MKPFVREVGGRLVLSWNEGSVAGERELTFLERVLWRLFAHRPKP